MQGLEMAKKTHPNFYYSKKIGGRFLSGRQAKRWKATNCLILQASNVHVLKVIV